MKVFLDANVFLDVLEHRGRWRKSLVLIQLIREKKIEGYVSALTIAIIYFLRTRVSSEADAKVL